VVRYVRVSPRAISPKREPYTIEFSMTYGEIKLGSVNHVS